MSNHTRPRFAEDSICHSVAENAAGVDNIQSRNLGYVFESGLRSDREGFIKLKMIDAMETKTINSLVE